jgi:hypothetical protein
VSRKSASFRHAHISSSSEQYELALQGFAATFNNCIKFLNLGLKGIVQRKLTGVESGINQKVSL